MPADRQQSNPDNWAKKYTDGMSTRVSPLKTRDVRRRFDRAARTFDTGDFVYRATFEGLVERLEPLVIRPAVTAYAAVPRAEREALGIGDGLIRLSVGIEDCDELIADLDRAIG